MKKGFFNFQISLSQYRWGIAIILLLTAFLRFYQLGLVPHGMTWDEAAIGYNGFAIFNTRRDEWLTRLPISFWSFGDYKAPLAIYISGIFTFLFGMSLFSVRLPFALAGLGSVLGMIYLARILWSKTGAKIGETRFFSLLAGALIMFSPWHHHFSRAGFESGMALMFYIWAIYFFFQALTVKETRRQYLDFLFSTVSFVASIYTYHSAKIVAPTIALLLILWHRKKLAAVVKPFLASVAVGLVALGPFVYDSLYGQGLARSETLITAQGNSTGQVISALFSQLASHLSTSFLIMGETTTLRHGDGTWGVLLPTTFVLIIIALLASLGQKTFRSPILKLSLVLLMVGLLPAALGDESPHSNRALLALPGFILLASLGIKAIIQSDFSETVKKTFLGSIVLFHSLFFIAYVHNYYTDFAARSATDWQDGYLEAFRAALPYERGEEGKREVEKIIFTSDYGQPYIYALFARQTSPIEYHGGSLIKYEFKEEVTVGDLERNNVLVVASNSDELLGENLNADQIIYGSDGLIRFRIYIKQ